MHPILFQIGKFPIGTYGVILALSALLAFFLGRALAPKADLDPDQISDLFVFSLLAAFVGAKLAMIIGDFRAFADHPGRFLLENLRAFGAFYGGLMAGIYVGVMYAWRHRISLWKAADVTVPCLAMAQALGRWGCFFAGCCYGKPTELPWGLVFPAVPLCDGGTRIHPWPVYESLGDLALFGFLLWAFNRRRFDGQIFLAYVFLYSILRGVLEFWRGDAVRGLYFGDSVSLSQIVAGAGVLGSVLAYALLRRRASAAAGPGPEPEPPGGE